MNSRAWMIGLLMILAVVCSTALAVVNNMTAPIIERNEEINYKSTVLDVFGLPYDSRDSESVLTTYADKIDQEDKEGMTLFHQRGSGATAVSIEGSGFQGHISLIVALDGRTIKGFKVVSQAETPGLGGRITEEGFQHQFIGKEVGNGIRMTKSGSAGPSEFDAITGATETSKALVRMLNQGFERYFTITGGS